MSALPAVAGMLSRGGSPAERTRGRLTAVGAALATWFLFGAAGVLALHGQLDQRLGPAADPGTRGGTAFAFGLLVLPVAAFLYQTGRLATADRERRLAALRLAGATPRQVRLLGMFETTRSAAIGTVIGAVVFLVLQWAGRRLLLHPGSKADVGISPILCAAAMVLVIVVSALSGLLAGRHVITTPLGVTRRARRGRPHWYGLALAGAALVLLLCAWLTPTGLTFLPLSGPVIMLDAALMVAGLMLSSSRLIWYAARIAARRARSAETLLAARALEADPRPWGRTMAVVGLAVAIGSGTGWIEAEVVANRHHLEPFWLTSFALVDLALLVGIAVTVAALLIHQAEYLLEHGPVLAGLRATGTSERELRRVLVRQALIAAAPPCVLAALAGFAALAEPGSLHLWALWPLGRAIVMAGLGVLAAVLAAMTSRRRLRRAISPARLRTE